MPAVDHIWPNHWARDAAAPTFAFDAAARARRCSTPPACAAGGAGPPRASRFTCLVPADPRFERLALLLQRQLLAVDVDMRLEALPLPEFQPRVASRPVRRLPRAS